MASRLDIALRNHPEHEEGIRLLAARDPSPNLKYVDWATKMLVSGQARAPEIADVVELFHRFSGQPIIFRNPRGRMRVTPAPDERIGRDIYQYKPKDLAKLRDALLRMKRVQDSKRRKRERLYRLEGDVEADVLYDADDLVVRHIKNKAASAHYGLNTQWCISMLRESYFESYDTQNATFFFFERKAPQDDAFDKVAVMIPRGSRYQYTEAFTATDERVDMIELAKIYGPRVFDIFRQIFERSVLHPPSGAFKVSRGLATAVEIEAVFATLKKLALFERAMLLVSICCNDQASWPLLEKILKKGPRLLAGRREWRHRRFKKSYFEREVKAALVLHPATPDAVRQVLVRSLRRGRVKIESIHRIDEGEQIRVSFDTAYGNNLNRRTRAMRLRRNGPRALVSRAAYFERRAKRLRQRAARLRMQAAKRTKKKGSR